MAVETTTEKKAFQKKLCHCKRFASLGGGHFEDCCAKLQRAKDSQERARKHREWLQRQEQNAIRRADWERRQAAWQWHAARRSERKVVETSDEISTVASECLDDNWAVPAKDDDWAAPAKAPVELPHAPPLAEDDEWAAPAIAPVQLPQALPEVAAPAKAATKLPQAPPAAKDDESDWAAPAKAPAKLPQAPPKAEQLASLTLRGLSRNCAIKFPVTLTFTSDEWKELLTVEKVLREIAAVDDLVCAGKKVDTLHVAKVNLQTELEGRLVRLVRSKDRAA